MKLIFQFYEYFLPVIVIIGLITSFEDIREGKIKNQYIVLGIILGIAIHLFLFFQNLLLPKYFAYYLINAGIGMVLGYGLYVINFWSAGDGKLLIAYSFLVPVTILEPRSMLNYFYSVTLLANTFIPFIIYYGIYITAKNVSSVKKMSPKDSIIDTVHSVAYVFSITWFAEIILRYCNISESLLFVLILSALFTWIINKIQKITKKNTIQIIIFILISTVRIYLEYTQIFTVEFAIHFVIYYFGITLIRQYIRNSITYYFKKSVRIKELKRGMIISDSIVVKNEKYVIEEKTRFNFTDHTEFPYALHDKEIKRLHELEKQGKLTFTLVTIDTSLPFAPMMFLGFLITVFVNTAIWLSAIL